MPPAVRLSDKAACPADKHGCPACPHPTFGPAVNGSTDVFINKLAAIRLDDPGIHMACCGPNQWQVAKGSPTVYVNGKPLARMGDKTKHCGGDGTLIVGSPNVFADDGALKGLTAKLAQLKDLLAGDAQDATYEGKTQQKKGSWSAKTGKAGKDKTKKSKGGGKEEKKQVENDEDIADDVTDDDSTQTGGLLRVSLDGEQRVFSPGQTIGFTVHLAKDYAGGPADVMLFDRKSDETFKTSVTPGKKDKTTAKGSIPAPALAKDEQGRESARELGLKAVKGEAAPVEAGETVQVVGGDTLVLRLYLEDRGEDDPGDEPTNARPDTTSLITERVSASVTIQTAEFGQKKVEVVFENGVAYVNPKSGEKPKEKWPKTEPADGEAYDPKVLAVEIRDAKYRDYSVKAFAPPTRAKK